MHTTDISIWKHNHDFSGDTSSAEKRTRIVTGFAATMMIVEIIAGYYFNSMALIADGWHMGTHVAAFVLAASAYAFARRHAMDAHFSFGTGKVGVLGGFASAIVLSIIALLMAGQSIHRLFAPQVIHFREALIIALASLAVSPRLGACAAIAAGGGSVGRVPTASWIVGLISIKRCPPGRRR